MKKFTIGSGRFPDVLLTESHLYIAYGDVNNTGKLLTYARGVVDGDLGVQLSIQKLPSANTVSTYPRLLWDDGTLWCAYMANGPRKLSPTQGYLWHVVHQGPNTHLGIAGGQRAVALGSDSVYWVGRRVKLNGMWGPRPIFRRPLTALNAVKVDERQTSQGISHITGTTPVYADEKNPANGRLWMSQGTDGTLTALDNRDSGLKLTMQDEAKTLTVYPKERMNAPRVASYGGLFAVVVDGPPHGIRLILLTRDDFA